LVMDSAGNIYGTTTTGGANHYGTIFKLTPSGQETVLYSFCGNNQCGPAYTGALVLDSQGNIYGTTPYTGTNDSGTIYKLSPAGVMTVLYNFCSQTNCADGGIPYAGVFMDSAGNLYGTTYQGGIGGYQGKGVLYKLSASGQYSVLHSFGSSPGDGTNPRAGVTMDSRGNLYGVTDAGGTFSLGTVYKYSRTGVESVLWNFGSGTDGARPWNVPLLDSNGIFLYGTTAYGGATNYGTVWKLAVVGPSISDPAVK
jgi:uncharacterized repeat protein (TIGR03803 family)